MSEKKEICNAPDGPSRDGGRGARAAGGPGRGRSGAPGRLQAQLAGLRGRALALGKRLGAALELQLADALAALRHLVGRDTDVADVLARLAEMALQPADAVVEPLHVVEEGHDLALDEMGLLAHPGVLEHGAHGVERRPERGRRDDEDAGAEGL